MDEPRSTFDVIAALLASHAFAEARTAWDAAFGADRIADPALPAEASALLAELEERFGDQLWFADRPGSAIHYRDAQLALMPPGRQCANEKEAIERQIAWTRIFAKLGYGTGGDGRRRKGAVGEPHPNGSPPAPAPAEPTPPEPEPITQAAEPPIVSQPLDVPVEPEEAECDAKEASHPCVTPIEHDHRTHTASPATPHWSLAPHVTRPLRNGAYEHFIPGERYRVAIEFEDFDSRVWKKGERFVYREYNYFPYDEGLTLYTDAGSIRLCGLFSDQADIMHQLGRYLPPDSE